MKRLLIWTMFFSVGFIDCNQKPTKSIVKIEMNLSSFGVEAEGYPTIHAFINLVTDSSNCKKSYFDPKYKDSTYSLSKNELQQIRSLVNNADLEKLKNKYSVNESDQPRSTITFYTNTKKIIVDDYGLKGEYPLRDLYKIVYKSNFLL